LKPGRLLRGQRLFVFGANCRRKEQKSHRDWDKPPATPHSHRPLIMAGLIRRELLLPAYIKAICWTTANCARMNAGTDS
jgi:hypothetical protein